MERIALYRKYRSADFDQLIGQDHVVRALEGALAKNLISHAYLLTGPRGVGKTSVARILARRINELPAIEELSAHLDIIEIDGASNRGIDEIRVLRERIASAPTSLKYKVYIIDEVHMLTKEAFNALLKTLEEPPGHVVFILATTEAHKLPDTIISRVQRFDFHPITSADIVAHLREIAESEKIDITDKALAVIAQSAEGGFRDAISLLDQVSVLTGQIDERILYEMLGMSPVERIVELRDAIAKANVQSCHALLTKMLAEGADPQMLTTQLIESYKADLLTSKDEGAARVLLDSIEILSETLRNFKQTNQYSIPLEIGIYKLALIGTASPVAQMPQKTEEQDIESLAPPKKAAKKVVSNSNQSDESRYMKALSYIKTKNTPLYAVMNMARHEIVDNELILYFGFSFHRDRVEEPRNRQFIEAVMERAFERHIELACKVESEKPKEINQDEELVSAALEILGGEVVDG